MGTDVHDIAPRGVAPDGHRLSDFWPNFGDEEVRASAARPTDDHVASEGYEVEDEHGLIYFLWHYPPISLCVWPLCTCI